MSKYHIEKNSEILVTVDDVLPDLIVVSFCLYDKLYQGVLLNSKKKLLPCGIKAPDYLGPPLGTASADKMFCVSQRYSYFQDKPSSTIDTKAKLSERSTGKVKNSRMTVRLRPRQVLCSKCRGICNENSENVDESSKKSKCSQSNENLKRTRSAKKNVEPVESSRTEKISSDIYYNNKKRKMLDPKSTSALTDHENKINGRVKKNEVEGDSWYKDKDGDRFNSDLVADGSFEPSKDEEDPLLLITGDVDCIDSTFEGDVDPLDVSIPNPSRELSKKGSVGSMEDLWHENVFEETPKESCTKIGKTPVIKISYGSGTVLKIAAKPQDISNLEGSINEETKDVTKRVASAKAARKALKKAKKEARRKVLDSTSPSPVRLLGGGSSCPSPRYSCLSPRYTPCSSMRQAAVSSSPPQLVTKKHKHKVKHKKRHKEERKTRLVGNKNSEVNEELVEECTRQKLSISLKRLKTNAYIRCPSSSWCPSDNSDEREDSEDAVPDFPGNPLPMMLQVASQDPGSTAPFSTSYGKQMAVGDVVWGKIHGFPWWPGKVVSMTESVADPDSGALQPAQAHVAWYGSSTSSLMPCHQLNPFLETFQMRYNKKKRGPYKEAIKQATTEAEFRGRGRSDIMTLSSDGFSSTNQTATVAS